MIWLLLREHCLIGILFLSALLEANESICGATEVVDVLQTSTQQNVGINQPGAYVIGHVGNLTIITNQPHLSPTEQPIPNAKELGANPYRGLQAFGELDSKYFFGRDKEIDELWVRLRNLQGRRKAVRFLPVYGSSGSGKSSLVRAGLIKKLADDPLPSYKNARVVIVIPGAHPLESLAIALARINNEDTLPTDKSEELLKRLRKGIDTGRYNELQFIADNFKNIDFSPLIILVDQFEEIYSLCSDLSEQKCFIENLLTAASDLSRRVLVVVTLRDDFLQEVQSHQLLDQLFSQQGYRVSGMDDEALREAINKPAELSNHPFNIGTVERLIIESRKKRGSLPLLQFALTRIWEGLLNDKDPDITLKEIGGVGGALANEAQRIYDSLIDEEKTIARRVLLKLVQIGNGTPDSRRRVPIKHLIAHNDDPEQVIDVIEYFADRGVRLLTYSTDNEGIKTVEVSHEALYEHWQQLNNWLEENRDDLRFQLRLEDAAQRWDSQEKPEGSLWRSPDLDLLKVFHVKAVSEMTALQLEFYQAAIDAEEQERQAVLQRDQEKKRQRNILTSVLSGGLILSTGLGGFAILKAWESAQNARDSLLQEIQALEQTSQARMEEGNEFEALLAAMQAGQRAIQFDEGSWPSLLGKFFDARRHPWQDYYTLPGHSDRVEMLTFSPDGTILATGSTGTDRTVKLWRVSDGTLITSLNGHSSHVWTLAFSPDGTILATGSTDKTVKLWRVSDGSLITSLEGHSDGVYTLTFSPDGTTLATGGSDGTVKLWRVSDGSLITSLDGHSQWVWTLAFSPDGTTLATGSGDKTVKLWRVSDGSLITSLDGHSDSVYTLAFSPDGTTLATGSGDKTVKLWRVSDGTLITSLNGHLDEVWTLAFSPNSNILATGNNGKTVKLWRVSDGTLITSLNGNSEVVTLAFSPDGNTLATGSRDSIVKLWRVSDGTLTTSLDGHSRWVETLAFSPDGTILATGSGDRTVKLWRVSDGALTTSLNDHSNEVFTLAFSPDGNTLATGSNDSTVKLWRVSDGTLMNSLEEHSNSLRTLAFSPDGTILATGSADNTVKLWRVSDGTLMNSLEEHSGWVFTLAFSPDGETLATGSGDSTVKLWRVSDNTLITSLNGHLDVVWTLAFSPDGKTLATGSNDSTVKLWRVSDGSLITSLDNHSNSVGRLAFSPDGTTLATGSYDSTVKLWRVSNGTLITSLDDHLDNVSTLAFSPDGTTLATGSYDSTVKLWRVGDGSLITSLDHLFPWVFTLAFSPDGTTLATGNSNGEVKLWRVRDGNLITSLDKHSFYILTSAFSPDGILAIGSQDSTVKLYPWTLDALMHDACDWVGITYIRNNPNMKGRRDICDGFETEDEKFRTEDSVSNPE